MGAALRLETENWANFSQKSADIVPLFQKTEVFRRHHVVNDPINYIDPTGLYKFGPGAQGPLTPGLDQALQCFESCSGTEVTVTSGLRPGGRGPHGTGNACDIGRNSNPNLSRSTAQSCYQQCFNQNGSYGQEESNGPNTSGTHFHLQNQPGGGGVTGGFPPGIAPYSP